MAWNTSDNEDMRSADEDMVGESDSSPERAAAVATGKAQRRTRVSSGSQEARGPKPKKRRGSASRAASPVRDYSSVGVAAPAGASERAHGLAAGARAGSVQVGGGVRLVERRTSQRGITQQREKMMRIRVCRQRIKFIRDGVESGSGDAGSADDNDFYVLNCLARHSIKFCQLVRFRTF